jgi:hypothetical protein
MESVQMFLKRKESVQIASDLWFFLHVDIEFGLHVRIYLVAEEKEG